MLGRIFLKKDFISVQGINIFINIYNLIIFYSVMLLIILFNKMIIVLSDLIVNKTD